MPRIRPLGDITGDMEPLLLSMVYDHRMQAGEILNLIRGYLEIHCPECFEEYEDGSGRPVFYYGPKEGLK